MVQCYSPLLVSAVVMTLAGPSNHTPAPSPPPPSPTCQRHFDMNKEGTTIAKIRLASPGHCCEACGSRSGGACEAYSFLNGLCYLSNSSTYHSADNRDLVSGLCTHGACTTAVCTKCGSSAAQKKKVRSLVVHIANDHYSANGSSAAVDSSALKLELIRFSDGKSMELPLASSQPVQSGSGAAVYSTAVEDVLKSSQGLCASVADCFALATFATPPPGGGAITNGEGGLALLANFKDLHLQSANVTLTTSGLTVTLKADAVTLYATVSSSVRGRFDRNAILLRPGVASKLTFLPREEVGGGGASFASTLHLEAVNLGSVKVSFGTGA
jgi:hypothetical protein